MQPPLLFSYLCCCTVFVLYNLISISHSLQYVANKCNDSCGGFQIPFPFYVNASCASISDSFRLSCLNSTTLYLNISSQRYPVLDFLSDGVLLDFPGTGCRRYNDLNAFGFSGNAYYGISVDNVVGLYDCEDSSLCKAGCETTVRPNCDGSEIDSPGCCYPLSDRSIWHIGNQFPIFSQYGCRGFSSWVILPGTISGTRGIKLEWGIPRNLSKKVCDDYAIAVNASTVASGVRCLCQDGFVGDGYVNGSGCLRSCIKDGQEGYGNACQPKLPDAHSKKKELVLLGVLAPVFIIALLMILYYLFNGCVKSGTCNPDSTHFHGTVSFRKPCRTRLFTYRELEGATRGFDDGQKLAEGNNGTIYAGVLGDGSNVAVHKIESENERDLTRVLSQVEILCSVLHRNMARLFGCCIDYGYTPLVVYEYPANGNLEENLLKHPTDGPEKTGLNWFQRMKIAAEAASLLAFLQHEISPPIYHHNLKSSCIFLDQEFSAKIAGFGLGSHQKKLKSDVYDLGIVLIEIITGSRYSQHKDLPNTALQKIRNGMLEEIVDPHLYYHEQPAFRREQIEIVADLATRCLLFGGDGKLDMLDVAKELVHITKDSINGSSARGIELDETFSNSSLLQMISMSPDSIYTNLP